MRRPNSGNCAICGVWRRSLHRDHVTPKFKGGSNDASNIQHICANCHEDKTRADLLGQPLSPGARLAQSIAQTGKKRPDSGPNISAGLKTKWADPAFHSRMCSANSSRRPPAIKHVRCGGCELSTTPGPLVGHQRKTGHVGSVAEGALL